MSTAIYNLLKLRYGNTDRINIFSMSYPSVWFSMYHDDEEMRFLHSIYCKNKQKLDKRFIFIEVATNFRESFFGSNFDN